MSKIIIAIALVIICSCTPKKEDLQYGTYAYSQTFCADPWPTGRTDSLTAANVIHYLDSLHLYVANVALPQEFPAQTCLACACLTGKIIYVTTFASLKDRYATIGFR